MNDLVKAVVNYKYTDRSMRKQAYIYKRTHKERIKDKAFKKLFNAFLDDSPVTVIGDVVLMDFNVYKDLENQIKELEENLGYMESAYHDLMNELP